eukprot:2546397-Rhodomonas_salina.1
MVHLVAGRMQKAFDFAPKGWRVDLSQAHHVVLRAGVTAMCTDTRSEAEESRVPQEEGGSRPLMRCLIAEGGEG